MGNFFDKLWVLAAVFIGVMIAASLLSLKLWLAVLFSLLITLPVGLALTVGHRRKNGNAGYRSFVTYAILRGDEEIKRLFLDLHPQAEKEEDYLVLDGKPVFLHVKYGKLSPDGVVKFYRTCEERGYREASVLTSSDNRKTLAACRAFSPVRLNLTDVRGFYRDLKKEKLLPEIKTEKMPFKTALALAFSYAFDGKNAKYFLFISFTMLVLSIFTFLKTYYLTVASVCLVLAVICLFKRFSVKK